jgi:hypothetical protein
MSTRVSGSLLLSIALVFAFNVGDFVAQDAARTTPATQTTQTDLSGTYAGTFNCEAAGLMGDTTLTITGNQFTTADGKSGRIVASTTGGYTAVALQLGESTPATTPGVTPAATTAMTAPQIISLRARKSGDRLTLMSVPGSMQKCTFTPTRTTARGRRTPRTPAAAGTEVANPATVPVPTTTPTESPMPEQTPAPSPSPTPTESPTPEPSPEPNPSPSPQPTQMPTPVPNPSPSPTASPSPTPSPTPSPAGHRR